MAKAGSPWTQREIDFLVRNYTKFTTKELAAKLSRPYGGVSWKIQQLDLPDERTHAEMQHELARRTAENRKPSTSGSTAGNSVGYPGVRTPMRDPMLPPAPTKKWWQFWKV